MIPPHGPTSTARIAPMRPGRLGRREALWGYLLIAPMMLGFAVFFVLALLASLGISLTRWDLFTPPEWRGLGNYALLLRDGLFRMTLRNTVLITLLYVPLRVGVALALALALNARIHLRGLFRVIYFLPVLTVPVASATVWKWLYDPGFGLINGALGLLGLPRPAWLADTRTALPAVVFVLVWNIVGRDMVIFVAGLQNIPRDYYEAAQIDGAGRWRLFRHLTLPLLTPTTFFALVVAIMDALKVFDIVYVMTQGGPANTTRTIVYYVYEEAFRNFRMGYAAAMTWVLFVLILIFTRLQFRLQNRWVHYG